MFSVPNQLVILTDTYKTHGLYGYQIKQTSVNFKKPQWLWYFLEVILK